MRPVIVALAAMLVVLLCGERAADAAMSRKACRSSCQSAIASCVTHGGHRAACKRQLVERCRRHGPTACAESLDSTTTTTIFTYSYPTTTLPGTGVDVTVHDVRTAFEVDSSVPAAGAQFLLVDVTIDNDSGYGFTPYGFQLQAGGLGFPQGYITDGPYPSCSSNVTILPGGSLSCTLSFEIPEGTPAGRLAVATPYANGPTALAVTDELSIPVAVRPSATLDILATGIANATSYCTGRPGFVVLQVTFAYTSHDGASGIDLNPYQFVLGADGAIYDPSYCGYGIVDPCDPAIGVPVDGSASCTLTFQVPASVTEAELRAVNTRYPAATTFGLD